MTRVERIACPAGCGGGCEQCEGAGWVWLVPNGLGEAEVARQIREASVSYHGPGIYRHYKGGRYEVIGLALWEPMAGKEDSDVKLADELVEFSNDFAATDWDMVSVEEIQRMRTMLRRAATLLSEQKFVIYEPLTPGSMLEDLPGVKFWARGQQDFNETLPRGSPRVPRCGWVSALLP